MLSGQIVYSGLQNISIPTGLDGVYLKLEPLDSGPSEGSVPGWDLNPYFGGAAFLFSSSSFTPARAGNLDTDRILAFDAGDLINGSSGSFVSGPGGSSTHLGVNDDQFFIGTPSYLGFQFQPDGSTGTVFGWMKVTLTNNLAGALIHDWAYESSGGSIIAGATAIPEPGTVTLLLGGISMLVVYAIKRKRSAL